MNLSVGDICISGRHKAGLAATLAELRAELKSVLCVSLNAQYILCFLDHLSPITEQWHCFNF